jgi:predicted Zn-dependent protease
MTALVLALVLGATAAPATDDAVVKRAMQDELARSLERLRLPGEAQPYYIAYTVTDADEADAEAAFGARLHAERRQSRTLRVDMRVGDPRRDNGNFDGSFHSVEWYWSTATVDDDYQALRRELWLRTDEAYRGALERFGQKRAAEQAQGTGTDSKAADFAASKPVTLTDAPESARGAPSPDALAALVTRAGSVLRAFPELHEGRSAALHQVVRRRFVSSEGSWIDDRHSQVRLSVSALAQADDGMELRDHVTFTAATPAGLPPLADMEKAVRHLGEEVTALRTAPMAASGDAVVLFEDAAAAQVLKRLFGANVSGTPPPKRRGGEPPTPNSLAERLEQTIAPRFLSAYDDPRQMVGPGKEALFGSYRVDDEGTPAERVTLIENGVLKSLLMSRTPRDEIERSNGHGRGNPVLATFQGRVGNLFVTGGRAGLASAALRKRALEVARAAGPKTAVYVVKLMDDEPLVAYRLENGQEKPVRGLTLEGLTPRSLRDIVAVGQQPYVFNTVDVGRGAGWKGVPMAIVTPALLFKDVDARRDHRKPPRAPVYPPPAVAAAPTARAATN